VFKRRFWSAKTSSESNVSDVVLLLLARHSLNMRRLLLCLSMLTLLANHAGAQGGEKKNALETIRMLQCSFPVSASGSWKDWTPKAAIQPGPELSLVIDDIDIEGGTARIGTTHTTALLTQNSVHFMERTMAGSLTMITVLSQKSPKGTLRAVRSRHDYLQMAIPGFVAEPNVSQHYGECEPTE
jgi:hypothetical protein